MTTNEPNSNDTPDERARAADDPSGSPEGILSADDLALEDDEHVRSIGDDRFLVATGGGGSSRRDSGRQPTRSDGGRQVTDGSPSPTEALAASSAGFGVDVTVKTEGGVSRRRVTSNDVREVFTEMLKWYALQLDSDSDPAETLSVLRAASALEF